MTRYLLLLALVSIAGAQAPVTVAMVKPWSSTDTGVVAVITDLTSNWQTFGTRPVTIDTTNFVVPFSAATLAQINPDVLWFSDIVVGGSISAAEQTAIEQFLMIPGKRVVGTFQVFGGGTLWLRPYFGIPATQSFVPTAFGDRNLVRRAPTSPLLAGFGTSYMTAAWIDASVPLDFSFDPGDTLGTTLLSDSNNQAIMHYYQGPVVDGIFFSYMPEYGGNNTDRQLLYNAFVVPNVAPAVLTQQGPAVIGSTVGLSFESPDTPNAAYAIGLALATTPGIPLLGGKNIPLNPDPLCYLSLTPGSPNFVHMSGFLDGTGVAPAWAVLVVPNNPALINATVFAAGVTLDSSTVSGVGQISLPVPITIQ
jgi:hypothetical protein